MAPDAPSPDGPPDGAGRDLAAYGLRWRLPFALGGVPEAPPDGSAPDVVVVEETVFASAARPPRAGCFLAEPGRIGLWHPSVGGLVVEGGRQVRVERVAGADAGLLRALLFGQAAAAVLLQRGRPALHGSAVAFGAEAGGHIAAFLGDKGAGKSTLAAGCVRAGHALVADDLVVWTADGEPGDGPISGLAVHPGYAYVKLLPEAAGAAGLDPDALPPLAASSEKRTWAAPVPDGPRPWRAAFVLDYGPAWAVERLGPRDAVLALDRHAFAGPLARGAGEERAHFAALGAVAGAVGVFRFTRPRGLGLVPEAVDRIHDVVSGHGPGG